MAKTQMSRCREDCFLQQGPKVFGKVTAGLEGMLTKSSAMLL